MNMRWRSLAAIGLLVLATSIAGCGTGTQDTYHDHPQYPCGPYWWPERGYPERFVQWTADGSHIVFLYKTTVFAADAAGSHVQALFDAIPGHRYFFPYGFHFDATPEGKQLVYASCEFPTVGSSGGKGTSDVDRSKFNYEIVTINLDGTGQQRLTENSYIDHFPAWSPDGGRIAFLANPTGGHRPTGLVLYTMAPDGSDVHVVAPSLPGELDLAPVVWSPDGEKLAFRVNEGGYWPLRNALYSVRLDGTEITQIAENVVSEASWSPDAQQLAVARVEGENIVLVTLAADGTDEQMITIVTAREVFESWKSRYRASLHTVSWSPDGSRILYTCDSGVCVVNLEDGHITELAKGTTASDDEQYAAAWSPDGSRIAVFTPGIPNDSYPDSVIPLVLYTTSRDGANLQGIAWLKKSKGDFGKVVAWNAPQARKEADASACSSTTVIPRTLENPEGLVEDCQTLLQLRDTLAGHATLNWNGETPITLWLGVTLGGVPRRVHELSLNASGLSGYLPPELGELSELRRLSFANVGHARSLKTPNRLTGVIPPELAQLTELERLSLDNNYLSGEIPTELSNLTSLERLELQGNFLTGTIPPELGNLTNLRALRLHGNFLTGNIPPELGNLKYLWVLQLQGNHLTRNIPLELGRLSLLENLNISNNQLTGDIPPELGNLSQVKQLNVSNNQLSGNIPPELGKLTRLESLQLGGNNLSGSLPPELDALKGLQHVSTYNGLHLQGNYFSGCVPTELPDIWVEASGLERCANEE